MQYKVLFIDWDGTLSGSRFWERWRDSPEDRSKYDLLQDVLFTSREGKLILSNWMTGAKSYKEVLDYASSVTGIAYSKLEKELRYSAENMTYIDTNALSLIQNLRKHGVRVAIATDNMDTFKLWTSPTMKLERLFDDVLVSDTLGAMKTHASETGSSLFFDDYLSHHGIEADQSVLIDDNLNTRVVEQWGINFLHANGTEPLTVHLERIMQKCS